MGIMAKKCCIFISEKAIAICLRHSCSVVFQQYESRANAFLIIAGGPLLNRFNNGPHKLLLLNKFLTNCATLFGHYSRNDKFGAAVHWTCGRQLPLDSG